MEHEDVIFLNIYMIAAIIVAVIAICATIYLITHRCAVRNAINMAGFAYDREQGIFYSEMYAWQRAFGYCKAYDEAAPLINCIVDCEPVRFRYKGKSWLIELWKGQYGITTGAEVGIYSKRLPFGKMYHSVKDKDRLSISCQLVKNGETLFCRHHCHWWLTGFKPGEFSQPSELTAYIGIDFPEFGMKSAFLSAIKNLGYDSDNLAVEGNTVWILYTTPLSPQPATRTPEVERVVQDINRQLCEEVQRLISHNSYDYEDLFSYCEEENAAFGKILSLGRIPALVHRGFLNDKAVRKAVNHS